MDAPDDDADLDAAEAAANARLAAGEMEEGGARAPQQHAVGPGAVVLHEDKRYYASAADTYCAGTETLVQEEDAQPIEVPIIAPRVAAAVEVEAARGGGRGGGGLVPLASPAFFEGLASRPGLVRCVAVLGALGHGKTTLIDTLVEATHTEAGSDRRAHEEGADPDSAPAGGPSLASAPSSARRHRGRQASASLASGNTGGGSGSAAGGGPAPRRFTDARLDEGARGISVKATPVSLPCRDGRGKHFLLNLVDAPGHLDFVDEAAAALRLADGVLLCVDAAEGPAAGTESAVRLAAGAGLPICLVVTKVDRLITELRLPPGDAYLKLRLVIEQVNGLVADAVAGAAPLGAAAPPPRPPRLNPAAGNVAFAGAGAGWSFTLSSFAQLCVDVWAGEEGGGEGQKQAPAVDADALAARLWGDRWYHPATRTFQRAPPPDDGAGGPPPPRSFIQFVLEPLYKLYAQVIGESGPEEGGEGGKGKGATSSLANNGLARHLAGLGVSLAPSAYGADVAPLLKTVLPAVLGGPEGLVSLCVRHLPSPAEAAPHRAASLHTGHPASGPFTAIAAADPAGPLTLAVAKLIPRPDATGWDALARVMSGTLRPGAPVRVLGPGFGPADEEDAAPATVGRVWTLQARYRELRTHVPAGGWALVEGVEATMGGACTVVGAGGGAGESPSAHEWATFRPLSFGGAVPAARVAVEPLHPSDLPKLVEGLRGVSRSAPLLQTRVEESGEHVLVGTGELALDTALRDLRELYGRLEVKVSDPAVSLCETVVESSALRATASSPNGLNRMAFTAEPLEAGLGAAVEARRLDPAWPRKRLASALTGSFGWDALAGRTVWAWGPDPAGGACVLLDDTAAAGLGPEAAATLAAARSSICQGFQWGSREGPLCDEPMRDVKFKVRGQGERDRGRVVVVAAARARAHARTLSFFLLSHASSLPLLLTQLLDATLSSDLLARGGGQLIPTARRGAYGAFLLATPRLMEPVYTVEVTAPADCLPAVYAILARRRGAVLGDAPIPGTPISRVTAHLPVLDAFGFEADVRYHTQGQAFPQARFDHWGVVPGDPLDRSVVLRPLEPAPPAALARELMVKARRRKGMAEDVAVAKFFDEATLLELAAAEAAGGGMGL